MKHIRIMLVVALALLVGIFAVACGSHDHAKTAEATVKKARYHCPMHPTYTSDKPGDCPICNMKLVPIEESKTAPAPAAAHTKKFDCPMHCEGAASDEPGNCPKCGMKLEPVPTPQNTTGRVAVHIAPDRLQRIGLRTEEVAKRNLSHAIRAVGRVAYAESRLASINTKFNGWVEKLYANATGQAVKKGEPLLDIYSPELVAAQEEYLIAFRARQAGTPGSEALLESSRRRLQFVDVTAEQIASLEKEGKARRTLTIASPFDGIVVEKNVVEGKAITSGESLFRVADLSTVWILADVYESELSSVKAGQEATATFTALPGEKFSAKVGYVYPYLDERSRTAKARLEAPNPDGKLKPDMWANVVIVTDAREALSVPASAVIQTGERLVAFVDKGDGHLEPRELKVGLKTDEYIEVLDGLSEGEKVVTRALFLVDSESQLRAAISGMGAAGEHQH